MSERADPERAERADGPGDGERSRWDSLAWGLVGALSFLVLVQGYELVVGDPVSATVKVGVAAGVGLVVAAVARTIPRRQLENESP